MSGEHPRLLKRQTSFIISAVNFFVSSDTWRVSVKYTAVRTC